LMHVNSPGGSTLAR